jgi:hypothetical protein
MKIQTTISLITATALALTSFSAAAQGRHQQGGAQAQDRAQVERGQRDMDRDRMHDRDRATTPARDRDRDQDRTHAPDNAKLGNSDVYGSELMSVEERNQYREQLRLTESDPKAQAKLRAQHEEKMRVRAKEKGVTVKEPEKSGAEK